MKASKNVRLSEKFFYIHNIRFKFGKAYLKVYHICVYLFITNIESTIPNKVLTKSRHGMTEKLEMINFV